MYDNAVTSQEMNRKLEISAPHHYPPSPGPPRPHLAMIKLEPDGVEQRNIELPAHHHPSSPRGRKSAELCDQVGLLGLHLATPVYAELPHSTLHDGRGFIEPNWSRGIYAEPPQCVSPAALHRRSEAVEGQYESGYQGELDRTCSRFSDAGEYLRQQLNLPPNTAVNLWALQDSPTGDKPTITLPVLVKLAIYGSPKKRLTLQEIYEEIGQRFVWFRKNMDNKTWKSSIRHNLSLNQVFRKVQRPVTEPGMGGYWELDISNGEGYKRPRKRIARRPKGRSRGGD
ncbi:hypothetical protein B0H14DRAFT_2498507 [Mycena olivaceomarginata]|nr:hypothetical protein B0H14DRAFT_2498507 [Mycena olivaceomarginata]